jgi:hypothetical protein
MAYEKLNRILSDPNEPCKGELSRLFRKIIRDNVPQPYEWQVKVSRYLDRYRRGRSKSARDFDRGNLNARLLGENMTWQSFLIGMRWLDVVSFKLKIELNFGFNLKKEYEINVRMRGEDRLPSPTSAENAHCEAIEEPMDVSLPPPSGDDPLSDDTDDQMKLDL